MAAYTSSGISKDARVYNLISGRVETVKPNQAKAFALKEFDNQAVFANTRLEETKGIKIIGYPI